MPFRIEVNARPGIPDTRGRAAASGIRNFLGVEVKTARVRRIFLVDATLSDAEIETVRREFTDPVVEESRVLVGKRVLKDVTLTARGGSVPEAAAIGVPDEGLHYRESVAVFTLDELDGMASLAGLRRVASAGSYEGRELGYGTRWILAYRKTGEGERS